MLIKMMVKNMSKPKSYKRGTTTRGAQWKHGMIRTAIECKLQKNCLIHEKVCTKFV